MLAALTLHPNHAGRCSRAAPALQRGSSHVRPATGCCPCPCLASREEGACPCLAPTLLLREGGSSGLRAQYTHGTKDAHSTELYQKSSKGGIDHLHCIPSSARLRLRLFSHVLTPCAQASPSGRRRRWRCGASPGAPADVRRGRQRQVATRSAAYAAGRDR
eukprot:365196-Chlamydomonas_euryale.AAC.4